MCCPSPQISLSASAPWVCFGIGKLAPIAICILIATDHKIQTDRPTSTFQLPSFLLSFLPFVLWFCCALPHIKCVNGRSCQELHSLMDGLPSSFVAQFLSSLAPLRSQKMETDRPLMGEIRYLCFGAVPRRKGPLHRPLP